MEVLYKNHIVRQRSFQDYTREDIQSINTRIAKVLPEYMEDFHFYNDRYSPITPRGNALYMGIVSHFSPVEFVEFSFSNQEKRTYKTWTFIIQ